MASNKIQDGKVLETTVSGTVSAGDPVAINSIFGIWLNDYTSGEAGEVAVEGVWSLNKTNAVSLAQGVDVFYTNGTTVVTGAATGGTVRAGVVWETAASAANTVAVKINATNQAAAAAV